MTLRLTTAGKIAVVIGALALIVLALALRGPLGALFTPAPGTLKGDADRDAGANRLIDQHSAQIDGRSLFFVPAAPPPPPPPRVAEADDEPSAPPPPPSRYGGPSLTAMINGAAWFSDGSKREPAPESDDDLRVVRLLPPWEAVVEWKGVEFTVSLFERDQIVLPDDQSQADTVALSPHAPSENDTEDPQ